MRLNRRELLKTAASSATAFLLPVTLPGAVRAATGNPVLVSVFLAGAADGLNAIVPHGDPEYYALRPNIGVPSGTELDLDGFYGLHPSLAPLLPLFQTGKLDVIHAVGSNDETRSHFEAKDFMERAAPGDLTIHDGWLNRYLAQAGGADLHAGITLDHAPTLALVGDAPSLAFPSIQDFALTGGLVPERLAALESLYQPLGTVLGTAVGNALQAIDMIADVPTNTSVSYPSGKLGDSLKDAAALIKADIGVRAIAISMSGWDTHTNEAAQLTVLLDGLAKALEAFHTDLGTHVDRTLLLTMTEFGRMVAENGGGGADHGHGSFMLAMGTTQARGRVLTAGNQWPGLAPADLFEGRDLAVTTDFRNVFAEVLDAHMGLVDLTPIFPGFSVSAANYPGLFS